MKRFAVFFLCLFSSLYVLSEEAPIDLTWVSMLVDDYQELRWLAAEDVIKTEEGISTSVPTSWSSLLFGKKYEEFERSIASLICYQSLFYGGEADYQRFTQAQPPKQRLSRESFHALHLELQELLYSHPYLPATKMHQAIQTALVLGDMGKTPIAREKAKAFQVDDPDHEDFIAHALSVCPQIFPSFTSLPRESQSLIKQATGLVHFGHVAHLEGGPEILSKLKKSGVLVENHLAFRFAFFVHLCDVAGALGHRNSESSLVLTEEVFKVYAKVKEACYLLRYYDEAATYRYYLNKRAKWLGLDSNQSLHRVFARIGAMLRLYTPQEGKILTNLSFSHDSFSLLLKHFGHLEPEALIATPTYIPAVLVNMCNNPSVGNSKEERIKNAVEIGFVFIARILEFHRKNVMEGKASGKIPLNFNVIAGIAKQEDVLDKLQHSHFLITPEGVVCEESNLF